MKLTAPHTHLHTCSPQEALLTCKEGSLDIVSKIKPVFYLCKGGMLQGVCASMCVCSLSPFKPEGMVGGSPENTPFSLARTHTAALLCVLGQVERWICVR
ncbi:hypothetical protein AMECASPLE_003022 [Ameca splendens]|uniref:Uncharacterized protein n=1 Tax=Ameca splendens TaxID=208324 RepID=A0ABV0XBI0_9TELE